ncbi:GGDEF domain-containing protein [Candidatus Shapirobacteria bacterium]|nr:GGDEF domain-containing protein [Candidatus Shapirobacteria bacterium]
MDTNVESTFHLKARRRKLNPQKNRELLEENHSLKKENRKLKSEALIDPLTGLYNRRALSQRLAEMGKSGAINGVTILILDVDNFKRFNEQQGHHQGDEVLVAVANTLTSSIQATDFVARFGGDEDVILFPNLTDTSDVQKVILRINQALEESLDPRGIHVSFGFATMTKDNPNQPQDLLDTLHQADDNLRKMKEYKNLL